MDPLTELAELLHRRAQPRPRLREDRARRGRVGRELRVGEAERHRYGDQPLLRTVVQIALDAFALGVGCLDDAGP